MKTAYNLLGIRIKSWCISNINAIVCRYNKVFSDITADKTTERKATEPSNHNFVHHKYNVQRTRSDLHNKLYPQSAII